MSLPPQLTSPPIGGEEYERRGMHMAYKGFDLTGKVALVTGGNGGIGFGMADAMAEAGADVCIWGTRKEKTDAAGERLKRHGRKVHSQIVDVGEEKQVVDAFA